MKDFIKTPLPKKKVDLKKIDRFIVAMNLSIRRGDMCVNTGLDKIEELSDAELKLVQDKAKKSGYSLTAFEDNYQTTTYKINHL